MIPLGAFRSPPHGAKGETEYTEGEKEQIEIELCMSFPSDV